MEDAHDALPRLRSRLEDELSAVTSGCSLVPKLAYVWARFARMSEGL